MSTTIDESSSMAAGVGAPPNQGTNYDSVGSNSGASAREAIAQKLHNDLCQACYDGDLETVRSLWSGTSLNTLGVVAGNQDPKSPLSHACTRGQAEVVDFILRRGGVTGDPIAGESHCPQYWAVPSVEILQLFGSHGVWPQWSSELWDAVCRTEDVAVVKAAVSGHNEDHVNDTLEDGYTPLHIASLVGSEATVQLLLVLGADPYIMNEVGQLPMHIAAHANRYSVAFDLDEFMSDRAQSIDWRTLSDGSGHTTLALADCNNILHDDLLLVGAKMNGFLADGTTTALEVAYDLRDWELVERLIDAVHYDFTLDDGVIDTAGVVQTVVPTLWQIVTQEHEGKFNKLVDLIWHSDDVDLVGSQSVIQLLCYYAHRGFVAGVRLLLEKEPSLCDAQEEYSEKTALGYAVSAGNAAVADFLRGDRVDPADESGNTSSDDERSDETETFHSIESENSENAAAVTEIHQPQLCNTDTPSRETPSSPRTITEGEGEAPAATSTVYTKMSSLDNSGGALTLAELAKFNNVIFAEILPAGVAGRGSFGVVWRGWYRGRPVAYKLKHSGGSGTTAPTVAKFTHEVKVLHMLQEQNHGHCLSLLGVAIEPTVGIAIVTEFIGGGSLKELLRGGVALAPAEAVALCAGLACGLSYIHEASVVHGDIKPANILVDTGDHCHGKLIDFGGSTQYWRGRTAYTKLYAAPEVRRGEFSEAKSDVFSLACVIYEVLTGCAINADREKDYALHPVGQPRGGGETVVDIVEGRLPQGLQGENIGILLACCWETDPLERLTSGELCKALLQILRELDSDRAATLSTSLENIRRCRNTPLMVAVQSRDMGAVSELLRRGHRADAQNHWGHTALHVAAAVGEAELLGSLLATQPRLLEDNFGKAPVDVARDKGCADAAALLEECETQLGDSPPDSDLEASSCCHALLRTAAACGDLGMAKAVVSVDPTALHKKDSRGRTPIDEAIASSSCDVVSYLLSEWVASQEYDVNVWEVYIRAAYRTEDNANVLRCVLSVFVGVKWATETSLAWRSCLMNACRERSVVWVGALRRCVGEDSDQLAPFVGISCSQRRWDVVDVLLDIQRRNGSVNSNGGAALLVACSRGLHALAIPLVSAGANVNYNDTDGTTPLIAAVESGSCACIELVLGAGACVAATNAKGHTAQVIACMHGSVGVIDMLLLWGAEIDHVSSIGTALSVASRYGKIRVVQHLLSRGADVEAVGCSRDADNAVVRLESCERVYATDCSSSTALMSACENGNITIVTLLLDRGADSNAVFGGLTAVMFASWRGHVEIVEELLLRGADASSKVRGWSAFSLACSAGRIAVVRILWGRTHRLMRVSGLLEASKYGRKNVVQLLLASGVAVDDKRPFSGTALINSSQQGHIDVMEVLLEQEADVNAIDLLGKTPLMVASGGGHVAAVKILLDHGAGVNVQDRRGATALMTTRVPEVAELLLAAGADVSVSVKGQTALVLASERGDAGVVGVLLEHLPKEQIHSEGAASLLVACERGRLDAVKLLLDAGIDVDAEDEDGMTSMLLASRDGHTNVVELLIRSGLSVHARAHGGRNALMFASGRGSVDIILLLLDSGAAVDAFDSDEWTPLMIASASGHCAAARALVDTGATVDWQGLWVNTALILASANGHTNCVEALLAAGANHTLINASGETALTLAQQKQHTDIVRVLEEAGAHVLL